MTSQVPTLHTAHSQTLSESNGLLNWSRLIFGSKSSKKNIVIPKPMANCRSSHGDTSRFLLCGSNCSIHGNPPSKNIIQWEIGPQNLPNESCKVSKWPSSMCLVGRNHVFCQQKMLILFLGKENSMRENSSSGYGSHPNERDFQGVMQEDLIIPKWVPSANAPLVNWLRFIQK